MIIEKTWLIDYRQAVFKGHFPDKPILPGVLIVAHLKATVSEYLGIPLRLLQVKKQKFVAPVIPDTELTIVVSRLEEQQDRFWVSYVANVPDGSKVAKGCVIFVRVDIASK